MIDDAYRNLPGINWSALKHMRVSPLQYRYALEHPRDDKTPAMRIGSAADCLLLEPDEYEARFATFTGKVRRGKGWDAFCEQHAGKTWLNDTERAKAFGCASAVMTESVADALLADTHLIQHAMTWTDAETGLACKGKIDLLRDNGTLVEIKTTGQLTRFESTAARFGYHCQLAFYTDGLRANGYTVTDSPRIILAQSEEPFDCIVYDCSDVISAGRREYQRLLRHVADCMERDEWPGIAGGFEMHLMLPPWAAMGHDAPALTMGGEAMEF